MLSSAVYDQFSFVLFAHGSHRGFWDFQVQLSRRRAMGIAITLAQYLAERGVKYDVVEHPHAVTASESAKTSHISLNRLAKAVVLKGKDGFMLAVLPASGHIQFGQLCRQLGAAYGLKVIVDDSLANEPEIYLEGGDHASLVHISGSTFRGLLADAQHARFTESP
jgi:Ala-tRNA(Pro) deacylase